MATKTVLKKLVMASLVTSAMLTSASAAKEKKYVIATASTGGTYYPVGV